MTPVKDRVAQGAHIENREAYEKLYRLRKAVISRLPAGSDLLADSIPSVSPRCSEEKL